MHRPSRVSYFGSAADALGNTTTFTYDPVFHLFVTGTKNPLLHTTTAEYDPLCQLPVLELGVNGAADDTVRSYDVFCRPRTVTYPDGDYDRFQYLNFGDPAGQYVATTHWGGAYKLDWFDGFGRTYKSAASGRTGAVADRVTTLTEFNDRGEIFRTSLPHFAGADPAEAPVWITSAYDALDRPVRQTFGDGKFVTIDYAASAEPGSFLAVTTTDELLGKTRVHGDAFGRTVRTDEIGTPASPAPPARCSIRSAG